MAPNPPPNMKLLAESIATERLDRKDNGVP